MWSSNHVAKGTLVLLGRVAALKRTKLDSQLDSPGFCNYMRGYLLLKFHLGRRWRQASALKLEVVLELAAVYGAGTQFIGHLPKWFQSRPHRGTLAKRLCSGAERHGPSFF